MFAPPRPTPGWTCRLWAPEGAFDVELGDADATRWTSDGATGTLEDVLAAASADVAWRAEAAAALRRQLAVPSLRGHLLLKRGGDAPMFHASRVVNRASIARHGLDWRRMAAPGVAGSEEPEWPGTFLCDQRDDARWFATMAGDADVWEVDVAGLWLEGAPAAGDGLDDGWMICCAPLGPERVRLVDQASISSRSAGA